MLLFIVIIKIMQTEISRINWQYARVQIVHFTIIHIVARTGKFIMYFFKCLFLIAIDLLFGGFCNLLMILFNKLFYSPQLAEIVFINIKINMIYFEIIILENL